MLKGSLMQPLKLRKPCLHFSRQDFGAGLKSSSDGLGYKSECWRTCPQTYSVTNPGVEGLDADISNETSVKTR